MTEHLFLTGGTGFIGRRLLKLWLRRTSARVTLLVRSRGRERALPHAVERTQSGRSSAPADRVSFVRGDLAMPGMGMSSGTAEDLSDAVTHIVHAGADLRFNLPLVRARSINTQGTAEVLDFARRCPNLKAFQYVGTAYVAGRNRDLVREEGSNGKVLHNNTYEQSKYEAEELVRLAMAELPASILRPTIVTCDLQDGSCPETSGFFRLLAGIASGTLDALPGRNETQLDMVPVDYVVESTFALGRHPDASGRCFHLSAGGDNLISLRKLSNLACRTFGRGPVKILPRPEYSDWSARLRRTTPEMGPLLDEIALYAPYLEEHPRFDDCNARAALAGTSLPSRTIPHYFDRIAAYVKDRAGRR